MIKKLLVALALVGLICGTSFAQGGRPLRVQEEDGDPKAIRVDTINVPNNSLTKTSNRVVTLNVSNKAIANVTYYVDPAGDDGNDGLSAGAPFATIQHAIDQIPEHLDEYYVGIELLDGTFSEGTIDLKGTASGYVDIYSSSYDADLVLIEGSGTDAYIFKASYSPTALWVGYLSFRVKKDSAQCVSVSNISMASVTDCKFGDDGKINTIGIKAISSLVGIGGNSDIDANKVAIGISASYDGVVNLFSQPAFGDAFLAQSAGGLITSGGTIYSAGDINLIPDNDLNDYIAISTDADQTTINFVGQDGKITADGGNVGFGDQNITNVGDIALDTISLDGTLGQFLMDAAADHWEFIQTSVTGTENQPLYFFDDDRTGTTADETSEATIVIDAEGGWALYILDGKATFEDDIILNAGNLTLISGSLNLLNAGIDIDADDKPFLMGEYTSGNLRWMWSTNSTEDDIGYFEIRTEANDTSVMFIMNSDDLFPNGMTDWNDALETSFVFANDEGADANDYVGWGLGGFKTSDVASAWYFDLGRLKLGAADGGLNGATTEIYPITRICDIDGTNTTADHLSAGGVLIVPDVEIDGVLYTDGGFGTFVRSTSTNYRRYYHLAIGSFDPGAAGATWTTPDANTCGGWGLDNAGETLEGTLDIHADWDGASDPNIEVCFDIALAGSSGGDTVDIKIVLYYKGDGDASTKTQTVEIPTTVDDDAQWTHYDQTFPINWDEGGNVLEVGDCIGMILNLETDTSEVDSIIITSLSFSYDTTHVGIESGDI